MKSNRERRAYRRPALFLPVLVAVSMAVAPVWAQTVYRVVTPSGQVTYTDNPERGGEAITLTPLPSVRSAPAQAASPRRARPGQPFMPYDRFVIESPPAGALIGEPMTSVSVRVQPPLREDHRIRLLVNGEVSQSALHSEAFWLTGLPAGLHHLEAELLDREGRVQHRTEAVSVTVDAHDLH